MAASDTQRSQPTPGESRGRLGAPGEGFGAPGGHPAAPGERPSAPGEHPAAPGERPSAPGEHHATPGECPSASGEHHAPGECLDAPALHERLEEEISRAGRQASALGCLLVDIEDLQAIEQAHGAQLAEQALAYVGLALRREFRRFDRVGRPADSEFVVVLPGADAARGEIVARRTLARLHAIKLEVDGSRRALRVSVGIAVWREGLNAEQLLAQARAATRRDPSPGPLAGSGPPMRREAHPPATHAGVGLFRHSHR